MNHTTPLVYRNCFFVCSVVMVGPGSYQPHVEYRSGSAKIKLLVLVNDAPPFRTETEAWRHTRLQAVRWVKSHATFGRQERA